MSLSLDLAMSGISPAIIAGIVLIFTPGLVLAGLIGLIGLLKKI